MQLDLDLIGFQRTNSEDHWMKLFCCVQHEFDPEKLLIRSINAEPPPKGRAEKAWVQIKQSNVSKHSSIYSANTFISSRMGHLLQMLCLISSPC